MIRKLKNLIWKTEGMNDLDTPVNSKGEFQLTYNNFVLGTLRFEQGNWYFEYSAEFKFQKPITPIIDFPDVEKKYQSDQLWPFFATRIPNLNQPFHEKKITTANINRKDAVSLLKVFGRDTITNPFQLQSL
jgi:HipA-like protein